MRISVLLFLLIFKFFAFVPQGAFANDYGNPGWSWPHMMGWNWLSWRWSGMFGLGLVGLVVVVILIFLIFQNTRSSSDSNRKRGDDPLEILKKRYAKGEISGDDYQKMKEDLK